jgi:hypothetical protein
MTFSARKPNPIDKELRRRTDVILRSNAIPWPLGAVALLVWALIWALTSLAR